MTWKITNSQDYAPKYVRYLINTEAVTPGTVDYNFGILAGTVDIDWGDGTSNTAVSANTTHTYSSPGSYIVTISQNGTNTFRPDIGLQEISVEHESVEGGGFWDNSMYRAAYNADNLKRWGATDLGNVTSIQDAWLFCDNLTYFAAAELSNVTSARQAWLGCTSLTSFPSINLSNATDAQSAWASCTSLTSFPAIDIGNNTASCNFYRAWKDCSSMTSFGACDLSQGASFQEAWQSCTSLTSFPNINLSNATTVQNAWIFCASLTSFPAIGLPSVTSVRQAWLGCTSLTSFPANMFDSTTATDYTGAFFNCALTAASVENILVSIDTSGVSNGTLGINGGTNAGQSAWTAAATTAYNNLITKGWTISANP